MPKFSLFPHLSLPQFCPSPPKGLSAGLALHLCAQSSIPVPAPAVPSPASTLVPCLGPVCHRSHLLPSRFVEVLATEARGNEVSTEGGDEGECGHKSQQRAHQIHQQRHRQLREGPHGDKPGGPALPSPQRTLKQGINPEAPAVRTGRSPQAGCPHTNQSKPQQLKLEPPSELP